MSLISQPQPASQPVQQYPSDRDKARIAYLVDQYKLYHGHINTMFNYFLVLAGLIANAYVSSLNHSAEISPIVPTTMAMFGFALALISLAIHLRSRTLMDIVEALLMEDEDSLFVNQVGFLTLDSLIIRPALMRHRYQFQAIYYGFATMFFVGAFYPYHDELWSLIRPFVPPSTNAAISFSS